MRQEVHLRLLNTPPLTDLYLRGRPRLREVSPGPGTTILIDGYPRSANTYAVAAFQADNPTARIARHLHSWRSVRRAVDLGLPAIVLIRPPVDAVASLLVYMPGLTAGVALRHYVEFYDRLGRQRDRLVVGAFDVVVSDFGAVVDRVNATFGTAFARYEHTPEHEADVVLAIERAERELTGTDGVKHEARVARPSDERRRPNEAARAAVAGEVRLLARAEAVHRSWT